MEGELIAVGVRGGGAVQLDGGRNEHRLIGPGAGPRDAVDHREPDAARVTARVGRHDRRCARPHAERHAKGSTVASCRKNFGDDAFQGDLHIAGSKANAGDCHPFAAGGGGGRDAIDAHRQRRGPGKDERRHRKDYASSSTRPLSNPVRQHQGLLPEAQMRRRKSRISGPSRRGLCAAVWVTAGEKRSEIRFRGIAPPSRGPDGFGTEDRPQSSVLS